MKQRKLEKIMCFSFRASSHGVFIRSCFIRFCNAYCSALC